MSTEDQQVYARTAQSAINRHKERGETSLHTLFHSRASANPTSSTQQGHYDHETVHSIINSTPVAHVSFIPDPTNPLPVVLPMIARVGNFPSDDEPAVYVHGYVSARMFRPNTGRDPSSSDEGLPVCIAATKIDNLVLALTPFNHSYDYRSAVIHGTATLLDPGTKSDPKNREEIIYAMQIITDGMVQGRWAGSRTPPDESEIAATRILKVRITSASAKIRDSGVKDDAKDLKNEETKGRVWTGVIPYVEMLGMPVAAETNEVVSVPAYIEEHVRAHNEKAGAGSGAGGIVSKFVSSIFGR